MRLIKTVSMICASFMITAAAAIAIAAEDADIRVEEAVKTPPAEVPAKEARFKFSDMRQDELMQIIEILDSQIGALKKSRDRYKKGASTEYAEIQKSIEGLESERAEASSVWSERDGLGK